MHRRHIQLIMKNLYQWTQGIDIPREIILILSIINQRQVPIGIIEIKQKTIARKTEIDLEIVNMTEVDLVILETHHRIDITLITIGIIELKVEADINPMIEMTRDLDITLIQIIRIENDRYQNQSRDRYRDNRSRDRSNSRNRNRDDRGYSRDRNRSDSKSCNRSDSRDRRENTPATSSYAREKGSNSTSAKAKAVNIVLKDNSYYSCNVCSSLHAEDRCPLAGNRLSPQTPGATP